MAEPALELDDAGNRRVERKSRSEVSAEDALATAKKTIEDRDRTIAGLKTTVVQTSTAASEQAVGRLKERETAIVSGIAAAEAAEAAGAQALRTAREAGDLDAELKAMDTLADAKLQKMKWNEAKTTYDANKDRLTKEAEALGKPKLPSGPDAESQRWLEEHPLIGTDQQYRKDADDAHDLAVKNRMPPGHPGYIAAVNAHLERLHGKDHGKAKAEKKTDNTDGDLVVTEQQRGTSMSAPAGRSGEDGSFSMSVGGKSLSLSVNGEGKEVLRGTIPGEWVEAAKWNKMTPHEYAISRLKIAKDGGAGGIQFGEGAIYR